MALTGNMIAEAVGGNASIVNYCMFVAVISMLALFYLFAVSIKPDFAMLPILPLILDALLTLFFLIGGIALAAELDVHSCGNSVSSISLITYFRVLYLHMFRDTYTQTTLLTDRRTLASDATRHKPCARSSGSASQPTWDR